MRWDSYNFGASSGYGEGAAPKVTGDVLTAIHLNDGNRDDLMTLAKRHFADSDVVGANDDVIELGSAPRPTVLDLFNSRGGKGTVEVIPAGRDKTPGVTPYRNDVVVKEKEAAALNAAVGRNRWGDDTPRRSSGGVNFRWN
jgi:hypothetical protein